VEGAPGRPNMRPDSWEDDGFPYWKPFSMPF
jgi:hypothetical protein